MLGATPLGLTGDDRVKQAARESARPLRDGVTGSRFMNGTLPIHLELERELAEWLGEDDALVYTAGYLANTGSIATLLEPGDTVICDAGTTPRSSTPCRCPERGSALWHGRLDKLETMLKRAEGDGGGVLVVVDGVFSMEGDLANGPKWPASAASTAPG